VAKALRVVYRITFALGRLPVLGLLLRRLLRPVTVVEQATENMVAEGTLFPTQAAVISHTQEWGTPFVPPAEVTFPEVGWRVFDSATVVNSRQFPFLITGHQMMVGHRHRPGPWAVVKKGNTVAWQDGFRALVNLTRGSTKRVDHAIYLGGRDFTNWYHWLVDGLPQLHLAAQLPEPYRSWPVLVPEQIFRYETMVGALHLFLEGREVIRMSPGQRVTGTLCWIDPLELTNLPESEVDRSPESHVHLLHREGMESYRRRYLERYATAEPRFPARVFLTRSGSRRSYNQEEMAELARQFGFEAVAPADLSLADQVQLFHDARHIIGPSGAGFAGLLFSQPGARALCWQDTRIRHMTILPDLATLTDSEYWHVFYRADSTDLFTSTYHLDPEKMRSILQEFVAEER
jgi:hypothetical protein